MRTPPPTSGSALPRRRSCLFVTMPAAQRIREKRCDRCAENAETLYRVRYDASGEWRFVCTRCQAEVARDNPQYTYGGTWKSRKRR